MDNVLIIRFSSVGDILLSSLLLRVFRRRFPACRLDYLVKDTFGELVRHNPNVSNVIEFPAEGSFHDLKTLKSSLRANRYDLVIDIHDSLRSRYLCLGERNVVRINKRKLARFILVKTKRNTYQILGGAPSVAERYLEPVAHFGVQNDGEGLEVYFPHEIRARAAQLLLPISGNQEGPMIGLAPSAIHANKMWDAKGFAEAALSLARERRAAIILFGSESDRPRCDTIERLIKDRGNETWVLNLAGRTTLLEAAAVMDRCSVVITNDSGLMHLAAARKRKVVALFGPTVREFGFFPYGTQSTTVETNGLSCRPCTHIGLPQCPKGHFRCMNDIAPGRVAAAANDLIGN